MAAIEFDSTPLSPDVVHRPRLLAAHTLKSYTAIWITVGTLPLYGDDLHVRGSVPGPHTVTVGEIHVETSDCAFRDFHLSVVILGC